MGPSVDKLTRRQLEVFNLICRSRRDRGYSPTLRELGRELGIRSTNGVNDHLKCLEKKGWLTFAPVKFSRRILLTEDAKAWLREHVTVGRDTYGPVSWSRLSPDGDHGSNAEAPVLPS